MCDAVHLGEVVQAQDASRSDGEVGAAGTHESSQWGPRATAVVGHGLVLAREVGQSALHCLGDGEAGVVNDVAQISLWQQVRTAVYFFDGKQHGLCPTEGTEVKSGGFKQILNI